MKMGLMLFTTRNVELVKIAVEYYPIFEAYLTIIHEFDIPLSPITQSNQERRSYKCPTNEKYHCI